MFKLTHKATSGGPGRAVMTGAASRLVVLPLTAACAFGTTRLLVESVGPEAYGEYALVTALVALFPFVDLGLSAAVINAVALRRHDLDSLVCTLAVALRVLCVSALVILLAALAISASDSWSSLLGASLRQNDASIWLLACFAAFAVTVPAGIGQRILVGAGKNGRAVLLQGLQAPMTLGAALALTSVASNPKPLHFAFVFYVSLCLSTSLSAWAAFRAIAPELRAAVRLAWQRTKLPASGVLRNAWPMLVQGVTVPAAMQTDRLVVSHARAASELAEYSLAFQYFVPLTSIVSAAGISLWPVYTRARAGGRAAASPLRMAAIFAGCATALAGAALAAAPFAYDVMSGGEIEVPWGVNWAFAALLVVQAFNFPMGMYMTDYRGLVFQVPWLLLLVLSNVSLSLVLVRDLGSAGPVLASVICVVICQVLPGVCYVRRRRDDARETDVTSLV